MKKIVMQLFLLILCMSAIAAYAEDTVTVASWREAKSECGGFEITVTVQEIVNPVLAVVSDGTGSVNLFGVNIDGEFTDFVTAGIEVGDTLVLANPMYSEYEGNVEMADSVLVEHVAHGR